MGLEHMLLCHDVMTYGGVEDMRLAGNLVLHEMQQHANIF